MQLTCRLLLGIILLSVSLSLHAQGERRDARVVLVTITGASDLLVDDFLARGVLPADGAFARLARTGMRAEHLIPIAAPETPTSMASLQTGAYPERHGIVGFVFHAQGRPIHEAAVSTNIPYQAETLVDAALRQGKHVVELATWPPREFPQQDGFWALGYPQPVGGSAVVELEPDPETRLKGEMDGFEHVRSLRIQADSRARPQFRLFSGESFAFHVLAVDSVQDDEERYDSLLLDFNGDWRDGYAARLRPAEWTAVRLPVEDGIVTSWVKVLNLSEDLDRVRLYLSRAVPPTGYPPEFVETLQSQLGYVPPGPGRLSVSLGLPGEQIWWELREKSLRYLRDAALHSLRNKDYDLLMVPFSLDGVGHFFYLRDPRQSEYEDGEGTRRQRYAAYVERGYQLVDRALLELLEAAPAETNFVVVSEHGMMSAHTQVKLNTALANAGFRVTEDETTELFSYSGGNSAHVYVNVVGREPNGVVPADKLDQTVERIVAACKALRSPASGEPIFDVVAKRSELEKFHMGYHENAGDVWVVARPGYVLDHQIDPPGPVWEPYVGFPGLHGHMGSYRENQGVFFAAGPDIPQGYLGAVRIVDIAATVSGLLGIEPPAQSQGRDVLEKPPSP